MEADLHTHSIYSDGVLSPTELVKLAKKKEIKVLSLTDHCSVNGVEEAIEAGKKHGVEIIPAVEVVCKEDEILGYFIDYENDNLKKELLEFSYPMDNKIKNQIKFVDFEYRDLIKEFPEAQGNYNPSHLKRLLAKKKKLSEEEAQKIYNDSKKQIDEKIPFKSIIEGIKLVKKYKGIPILAHPWVEEDTKILLKDENFKKLIDVGLQGIEIDNGDRDERRDENTIERIKELAEKYNLIITSGSDFHGQYLIDLTGSHKLGNTDLEVVKKLKKLNKKWD